MKVLSIDVGSKHMVFCVIQHTTTRPWFQIMHWHSLNCHADTCQSQVQKLSRELRDDAMSQILLGNDEIIIESQTNTNIKMKVLSHCLQIFFFNIGYTAEKVVFASPLAKLKICPPIDVDVPKKNRYRINKQNAVKKCSELLMECVEPDKYFLNMFNQSRKKDDFADSLLQAVCRIKQYQEDKQRIS